MIDPQRSATLLERALAAANFIPSTQVGLIDAAMKGRNPLQTVPRAVYGHRTYGDLVRENIPREINVPVPRPGVPMLGVPPGFTNKNAAPALAFGLGTTASIFADPTTYMGVGALTKLGQARKIATMGEKVAELGALGSDPIRAAGKAEQAGRLAPTMAEQARRGERALVSFAGRKLIAGAPVLGAAEKALEAGKALTPFLRVAPELKGLEREAFLSREAQVRAAPRVGQREAVGKLKPIADEIHRVARQHGINEESLRIALSQAVELSANDVAAAVRAQMSVFGAPASRALGPHARKAVDAINAINATNLARKQAEGIPISRLMDDIEYLRRLTTPEARRIIEKRQGGFEGFAREITERHGAQKGRSFHGITTAEANELWQTGQLASNGNKATKTKLFVDDPFVATVMATGETERAIEASKMLRAYAASAGRPAALAPEGAGWLPVGSDLPALKGVLFPPEVARTLSKHFAPASKEAAGRAWRTLNATWAKWTTGPFPGFHARNEMGDVWNAYVLGGADPRKLADAVPLMLGKGRPSYALGGRAFSGDEIMDLAGRLNVMDSSFMRSVVNDVGVLSRPKGIAEALDNNALTRIAERTGQAREGSNRLAMFMDGLDKGMEPAVAAERVRSFLFDYGRLPDGISALRSNAMPFLAWTYYDAPLQMSSLFRKPGAFTAVQKLREEAGGERGLGLGEGNVPLPAFLRRSLPLPLGESEKGDRLFARMEGFWPGADLGVFSPAGAVQRAANLVTPLATTLPELAFNTNLYRSDIPNRKLEPQAPAETGPFARPFTERGSMLGLPVPKRALPAFELIRMLTEIDRMNPGGVFGSNERPNALGAMREFPDAGGGQRAASFLLGLRNYAITPERQELAAERSAEQERRRLSALQTMYLRRGDETNAALIGRMLEALNNQPERAAR